ncbi:MAG: ATP-binding protein [Clostridia bacterium]
MYINIKDDGIGISKDEQENIFDRFYRVDKSRNKETGGVGLGLAIAKSIANINSAEIKLESKLGEGSKFIIIFNESMKEKQK